jgi:Mn-containing catalase
MKDTLNFLMSREVAHQQMFEAALASIEENFPPGTLAGDEQLNHAYIADSGNFGDDTEGGPTTDGYDLAQANSTWGFELDTQPVKHAAQQVLNPNEGPKNKNSESSLEKAGKKIKETVAGE